MMCTSDRFRQMACIFLHCVFWFHENFYPLLCQEEEDEEARIPLAGLQQRMEEERLLAFRQKEEEEARLQLVSASAFDLSSPSTLLLLSSSYVCVLFSSFRFTNNSKL